MSMVFTMTSERINSWMFLAVAMSMNESAASLSDIIGTADVINHAIPTHSELQTAFGWMSKQGLLSKEDQKYRLTQEGLALYREASSQSNRTFEIWHFLKERFSGLNTDAEVDPLTSEEVDAVSRKYTNEIWKQLRK